MNKLQLSFLVNTHNYDETLKFILKTYNRYYKKNSNIKKIFNGVKNLFDGKFKGYRECNTQYHDFQHTVDATISVMRLIDGYNIYNEDKNNEIIPQDYAFALIVASLFHDTGYIQEENDVEGTGAKYTKVHVQRSIDFISKHYDYFNINKDIVDIAILFIQSTGLSTKFSNINFKDNIQRDCGALMGTADLIGQMSDREYLERLLFLYYEFKEAGIPGYNTEFDIIRNTLDFYNQTIDRLNNELLKMYEYALYHFKVRYNINVNLYMEAIKRNIDYIKKIIQDNSTNFRHKLKRGDQMILHTLSQNIL